MDAQDESGMTAVVWATFMGHVDIIRVLLAKGVDFTLKDRQGMMSVMHAAKKE